SVHAAMLPAPPPSALLRAPIVSQFPEYKNGCELASLDMLLRFAGLDVSMAQLVAEVPRANGAYTLAVDGAIRSWGDPADGFVGSVRGIGPGFGVYHAPIAHLLARYLGGSALDLTGGSFAAVLGAVAQGRPVIAWTTVTFSVPHHWLHWESPQGFVRATMNEHAVLIVGYDAKDVFVNNPFDGEAAEAVDRARFEQSWIAMGRQAVTVAAGTFARVRPTPQRKRATAAGELL
ncbi:MAG: C39 family peptidase, partial [Firmicutes bacterium]|nr:C39 family peptidase [Bacillota bacterium]